MGDGVDEGGGDDVGDDGGGGFVDVGLFFECLSDVEKYGGCVEDDVDGVGD